MAALSLQLKTVRPPPSPSRGRCSAALLSSTPRHRRLPYRDVRPPMARQRDCPVRFKCRSHTAMSTAATANETSPPRPT